jgi:hypothetical protein
VRLLLETIERDFVAAVIPFLADRCRARRCRAVVAAIGARCPPVFLEALFAESA